MLRLMKGGLPATGNDTGHVQGGPKQAVSEELF